METEAGVETQKSAPLTPGRAPKPDEGLRVIFEQVLVALILAFIFRAFVLEAFVIPTGSMAPTLLGAHMRFRCPDCGWRFEVNYPTDSTAQVIDAAAWGRLYAVRCPNCAYRFPRENPADPANDASEPLVSYGDRVLVLKHAYLLRDPRRWEVVVFKNPSRGGPFETLPEWSTEPYQQNYIKRLIGLPEERIMLVDGDVYVNQDKHTPDHDLRPDDFTIARKSATAQSALWRIVYDDAHRPQGLERTYDSELGSPFADPPWQMPWRQISGDGWSVIDAADGGGFAFDNAGGAGVLSFDASANPSNFSFTDYLAYDIVDGQTDARQEGRTGRGGDPFRSDYSRRVYPEGPIRLNVVADLRLALFYERQSGEGPLVLTLTKRSDVFEAEIGNGVVRLTGMHADGTPMFAREAAIDVDFATPHHIEFINADYRLRLKVDGTVVLETSDDDYAPDIVTLVDEEESGGSDARPSVSITAANQLATLRHVSLWRDVYHTARDHRGGFYPYASPEEFPDNVIRLGEGEYFTLGDNPLLSGDARGWLDGVSLPHEGNLWVNGGRVPQRFMLGRAFFVYWPAGFRPAPQLPSIVPNFGEMRFIR